MLKKYKLILFTILLFLMVYPKMEVKAITLYTIEDIENEKYSLTYNIQRIEVKDSSFIVGDTLGLYGVKATAIKEGYNISSFSIWENPNHVITSGWQTVIVNTKTPDDSYFKVVLNIFGEEVSNGIAQDSEISPFNLIAEKGTMYNLVNIDKESKISYSSSNKKVVKVGKTTGVVSFVGVGSATITQTIVSPDYTINTVNIPVTVDNKLSTPYLNKHSLSLSSGIKYKLNVQNVIVDSTYKWSTSDSKIATVKSNGIVTTKKAGKAYIYCTITSDENVVVLKCNVNVK